MTRSRLTLTLVAALVLAAACYDTPTAGYPGNTLTVRLTTPHTDDGAILFTINGPAIDSVTAGNGSLQLFTRRGAGSTVLGAVVGPLAGGVVLTLYVPDPGAAAAYDVIVREVADRQDALRSSLGGYALTVSRP